MAPFLGLQQQQEPTTINVHCIMECMERLQFSNIEFALYIIKSPNIQRKTILENPHYCFWIMDPFGFCKYILIIPLSIIHSLINLGQLLNAYSPYIANPRP